MKRIAARISLILLLALLFSLASVPASAEPELVAYGYCGDEAIWALDSEGNLYVVGEGAIYDFGLFPDGQGNYYYLEAPWYEFREQIRSLEIDGGITRIGKEAFQGMALETVTFHEGLQEIGPKAFFGCSKLQTVVFPQGVTTLGDSCFAECKALKEVYMPTGLVNLGYSAFASCFALEKVTLASDLKIINESLFSKALRLKNIEIPSQVTDIHADAFYGTALESVSFPQGLRSIGDGAFLGTHLKSVVLPDSMEYLGTMAFACCGNLESVELPDGIRKLTSTFEECSALREVKLPRDLEALWGTFEGCMALESIELPERLKSIGDGTFYACYKLQEVTIPASVRKIGAEAFSRNYALKTVTFQGNALYSISETAFREVEATVYYPGNNNTWTDDWFQDYSGSLTWLPYDGGVEQHGYMAMKEIPSNFLIEVDGKRVYPDPYGDLFLDTQDAKMLVYYEYNTLEGDVHTQYPVKMVVCSLEFRDGAYQSNSVYLLTSVLRYAGSSIRIVGKKGIRMITAVPIFARSDLISGKEDYTLLEYGTVVAWDSELNGETLTLEHPAAKSAYAYLRGEADQQYKVGDGLIQYTNVLVGFSNDQCIPDLSMRPYMKLQDRDGNVLVIYGGTIHRSIGYIALQNRNAFQPGTTSYEYIWGIIHHVYGTAYDAEYKG